MPRSASARTSLRRLSWVCCTTPGIDDDGSGASMPFLHEQRRDEVVDAEPVLGDEAPQRRRAPQPAQAPFGERHGPMLPRAGAGPGLGRRSRRTGEHQRGDEAVDGVRVGLGVDAEARARARSPT